MNNTVEHLGTVSKSDMQAIASGEKTLDELGKIVLTTEQANEIAELFEEVVASVNDLRSRLDELNIKV